LQFLAGLGVFLFAVKLLGGSLEKLNSVKIKKGLNKLGKNPVAGTGFGTLMAFVTQSSLASVVMTMSFADSYIITFYSAIAIIFGCNIGTSLSTILIAFNSFKISEFFAVLVLIGALISTFSKNKKIKEVGVILASLGMFFIGLNLLSGAFSGLKTSETFLNFFANINNAFIYFILGIVITLLTQSSTVTIAILISLVGVSSGFDVISLVNCAYVIYGSNIGTALTAFILSFSEGLESKKVAFCHLVFNIIGAILFVVLTSIGYLKLFDLLNINNSLIIVLINVLFNVITSIILFPFIKLLYKFTEKVIKGKINKEDELYYIKQTNINSSTIVINQLNLCVIDLINRIEKVGLQVQAYCEDYNITHSISIKKQLDKLSTLNDRVKDNLIAIQSLSDGEEENVYFLQVTTKNIERILRNNNRILEYVKFNKDNNIKFTQKQLLNFKTLNDYLQTITKNVKIIVDLLNKNKNKKEYYIPNLKILETSVEVDNLINSIKRESIATNIYSNKKLEKFEMYINVINAIEDTSVNFTDIALTVTNFFTDSKEQEK